MNDTSINKTNLRIVCSEAPQEQKSALEGSELAYHYLTDGFLGENPDLDVFQRPHPLFENGFQYLRFLFIIWPVDGSSYPQMGG